MVSTPFELTGVKTSIADGEDWCEDLANAHAHVTLHTWGQPAGPTRRLGMYTLTIGTGPVGATLIGSIHGEEPAGREACMAIARDLAETTDPTMTAYLADHAVSIMVTANPSGLEDDRRTNDNGEDLNRNYDTLDQPETIAIGAWMEWAVPVLTVDLHEMTAATMGAQVSTGTMPTDGIAPLLPLGVELDGVLEDALVGAGYTWLAYPTISDGTIRKHGVPRWKMVCQLVETNRNHIATFAGRVDAHRIAVEAALEHHRLNAAEYEAAHVAAGGVTPPPPSSGKFMMMRGGVPVAVATRVIRGGVPVEVN